MTCRLFSNLQKSLHAIFLRNTAIPVKLQELSDLFQASLPSTASSDARDVPPPCIRARPGGLFNLREIF